MTTRLISLILLASFGMLLLGCSSPAYLKERRVRFCPSTSTPGVVEQSITRASKMEGKEPQAALGGYLSAAEAAALQLSKTPHDPVVREDYNFAIARIFSLIRKVKQDPWSRPLTLSQEHGGYVLNSSRSSNSKFNPIHYDLLPADQAEIGGALLRDREVKQGLGAPLVAVKRGDDAHSSKNFSQQRFYHVMTAVVRFNGKHCEISLEDPLTTESITLGRHTYPLAADFTAPLAAMISAKKPHKMGLARLLNPEKYESTAQIVQLQPYDENKTVVLLIHGLNSSPATWAPLINRLWNDEPIRRNYQFWLYSYPSGWPYPHSAAVLRKEMDTALKQHPLKQKMIVIGHSMGGCISRLLITDVGDRLWLDFFGKHSDKLDLPNPSRKLFEDAFIFNHRPEIGRVIFVAAPLRGAEMAQGWIGRLGSALVRTPSQLAVAGGNVIGLMTQASGVLDLNKVPTSVDTLSPNERFVKTINQFPIVSSIPHHSIVGDRGKGRNKDQPQLARSDGFVPYWSSHLDSAQSELIVPSGHGVHQHPEAIMEVRRILFFHRQLN
jgi:pimeloyl-ACP methyl ester carboxylesterase